MIRGLRSRETIIFHTCYMRFVCSMAAYFGPVRGSLGSLFSPISTLVLSIYECLSTLGIRGPILRAIGISENYIVSVQIYLHVLLSNRYCAGRSCPPPPL